MTVRLALGAAAAVLMAGCCMAPGPPMALLLHPMPPAEDGYTLSRGGLHYASDAYRVSVRPVDWREMEECRVVTRQGKRAKIDASRHVFFAVLFDNLSAAPMRFDPSGATAVTERGVPLAAAGFGESAVTAPDSPGRGLPVYLQTRSASLSVPSGESREGILAYRVPNRGTTAVTLILNSFSAVPAEKPLHFIFEAFPGSPEERR